MNAITIVVLAFSVIGAVDYLIGNKFGIGKEFSRAFTLFCPMALSMLGMIVVAPAVGAWLTPVFEGFHKITRLDPSIIPASLLANDMGGMTLSESIAVSPEIGSYNAFVTSSMLGCVISFTIPFALGIIKREQHNEFFFGTLCGIITVPIGCFVSGLICRIHPLALLLNLLPLVILSAIVCAALLLIPKICIKCFEIFGIFMKSVSLIGLVCSIFTFLTKIEICEHFDTFENAAFICANACVTLSGALPFMFIATKLLSKPLDTLGSKMGIDSVSALALLGSLVTNASTFGIMEKMNKRGTVLNSAFAVSASFVFGSHLAFTMAYNTDYVLPMIVGKLISGASALVLAYLIYKDDKAKTTGENNKKGKVPA